MSQFGYCCTPYARLCRVALKRFADGKDDGFTFSRVAIAIELIG
jgi:hypothetical protein